MKKTKMFIVILLAALMVIGSSMTALADQPGWGWIFIGGDDGGWKYMTKDVDFADIGRVPREYCKSGWYWIDDIGFGTASCFCFDDNEYRYTDCVTPDGYTVDQEGRWVIDGVVQTKEIEPNTFEKVS